MKISVIIPTLNEEEYISGILEDLQKQTVRPYEILIIDGGSTDKTQEISRKTKHVQFFTAPKPQGRQRNIAAGIATGEMFLFVDADTRIEPSFLADSLNEIKKKKLDIAIPRYFPYSEVANGYLLFVAHFTNFLMIIMQKINPFGGACGMFVTKKVFDRTHGFEEKRKIDDIPMVREAVRYGRYGIISTKVRVSERRFLKYGTVKMSVKYFVLYLLLTVNLYSLADRIDYQFGEYTNKIKV